MVKNWDEIAYKLALVFPDVYDLGMSNLGLAILYDIVNQRPDMLAERAYTPWTDMLDAMKRDDLPLYSLETRHPLAQFDVLGFSLPYEQLYTNVLSTLDLAGIPLLAADRTDEPLVLAGGSACMNPEPMHAFFDAFFVGEGEEAIVEMTRTWKDARAAGRSRTEALERLAQIDGVYVPSFYDATYNEDGTLAGTRPNLTCREAGHHQAHRHCASAAGHEVCRAVHRHRAQSGCHRDSTGLHPGLPLLPGGHDLPPGARTARRRGAGCGRQDGRGDGLRRGLFPLPLVV